MKKSFIYFISLLMIGLVACTEDFNKDIAPPQTNEPEEAKDIVFKVDMGADISAPLLLGDKDPEASVELAKISQLPGDLYEGSKLGYSLRISKTDDFAEYTEIASTTNETSVSVLVKDLDAVIKEMFGKAPNANEVYIKTIATITAGTQTVRGTTNIVGPATITPISMLIEEAYYLIGDMTGWNPATVIPFNHSGKDVYDDPLFSLVVKVGAGNNFKIVPQSALDAMEAGGEFWDHVIGTAVDGDTSPEGNIVTTNAGAIKVEEAGDVRITLDMSAYTYKVEPTVAIESAYYLIGDMTGWDPNTVIPFSHSGKDVYEDPIFSLIVEVAPGQNFKIVPQGAIDAFENNGDFWSLVIGTAVDGDTSPEGNIVTENAGAIKTEHAGFVRITLDMLQYRYKVEPMESSPFLYIPGNHQGWSPETAPQLFAPNSNMKYEGFAYLDGAFKFTSHPDWEHTNYGDGGEGKIDASGGDIVAEAGFYLINVDLNSLTYSLTETTWGLIGDATAGSWDSSTPMEYDRESNTWSVTTDLEGGKEMKFRANDGWDINLGGDLSGLTFGGDNIVVAESGSYLITLTLSNASAGYKATMTKQ